MAWLDCREKVVEEKKRKRWWKKEERRRSPYTGPGYPLRSSARRRTARSSCAQGTWVQAGRQAGRHAGSRSLRACVRAPRQPRHHPPQEKRTPCWHTRGVGKSAFFRDKRKKKAFIFVFLVTKGKAKKKKNVPPKRRFSQCCGLSKTPETPNLSFPVTHSIVLSLLFPTKKSALKSDKNSQSNFIFKTPCMPRKPTHEFG